MTRPTLTDAAKHPASITGMAGAVIVIAQYLATQGAAGPNAVLAEQVRRLEAQQTVHVEERRELRRAVQGLTRVVIRLDTTITERLPPRAP